MLDTDDIEKIATAVAAKLAIDVPLAHRLWTGEQVAKYLNRHTRAAMERVTCLPTFPKPIKIITAGSKNAHPQWKAIEVIRWAERQQKRDA